MRSGAVEKQGFLAFSNCFISVLVYSFLTPAQSYSLFALHFDSSLCCALVVWAQTDEYIQELQKDKTRSAEEDQKVKEQRQQEVEAHARVPQGPTLPNLGVQNRLK